MENKTIDILNWEDMIRDKINFWRSQLIDRYVSFQEGMNLRRENPNAKVHTQIGAIPISHAYEIRRNAYFETRQNVKTLEALLKEGEEAVNTVLLSSTRSNACHSRFRHGRSGYWRFAERIVLLKYARTKRK